MHLHPIFSKFLKFGIVGTSGMAVDIGILFLLRNIAGLPDLWANTISFTAAATSNYVLNRIWTFRSHNSRVATEYLKFLAVSIVGLGINNGVLYLSSLLWPQAYHATKSLLGFNFDLFYLFKLLAIAITTLWNFFGNMLFTFRKQH